MSNGNSDGSIAAAELERLQNEFHEPDVKLDNVVLLMAKLREAGRHLESISVGDLFSHQPEIASNPYFHRERVLSYIADDDVERAIEAFLRFTNIEFEDQINGIDVSDLWVRVTRACTRRLDRDSTDRWLSATREISLHRATDKLRIERYTVVTSTAWQQLATWRTNCSSDTAAVIRRTSYADLMTRVVIGGENLKKLVTTLRHPTRLLFPITDPPCYKDPRMDALREICEPQIAKLRWPASYSTDTYNIQLFLFPDARVLEFEHDGRGGIVMSGDLVCKDICYEHCLIDVMGHYLAKAARRVESIAFAPVSTCPGNYYHDLIDTFGSMLFYTELGMDIPIVIPKPMNKFLPLFHELGIHLDRIRTYSDCADVCFERLIYADRIPLGGALQMFLRRVTKRLTGMTNSNPHIYISRKKAPQRCLANELQVEAALESLRFDTLILEDMPLAEQIQRMRDARVIISPHGAGLANMLFCDPGTIILEFIPNDYQCNVFHHMAEICGHPYVPILGTSFATIGDQRSGWEVDVNKVLEIASRLVKHSLQQY